MREKKAPNFNQGIATFPGVGDITRATMTLSHGITPSICTMVTIAEIPIVARTGTLQFRFGKTRITFPDSTVRNIQFTDDSRGYRLILTIVDRRWKWEYGIIYGRYNVVREDGEIDANTKKTPQQLATLLLFAMGEQNFSIREIPNTTRPSVNWVAANPAKELAALCDQLGCRIALTLNNTVRIVRVNEGKGLPFTGTEMTESTSRKPSKWPGMLKVVGAPILVQSKLMLDAVGEDIDGSIKILSLLSYKPMRPWGKKSWFGTNPRTFASVTDTYLEDGKIKKARDLALKTVYRMYRVTRQADGSNNAPGPFVLFKNLLPSQLLPINDHLATTHKDDKGIVRFEDAYIDGKWWSGGRDFANVIDRVYSGSFAIDKERGLVIFSEPVTKLVLNADEENPPIPTGDEMSVFQLETEPDLFLTTSYSVTHKRFNTKIRYENDMVRIPGADDSDAMILSHPELLYRIAAVYNADNKVVLVDDNLNTISRQALTYLTIAKREILQTITGDSQYAGLVPIDLDGAIQQVTWTVGGGATTTRASRNREHDISVNAHKNRRRKEKLDQLIEENKISAPVRR